MQIECKWCDGLNKNNLKHKLYMTHNLWEDDLGICTSKKIQWYPKDPIQYLFVFSTKILNIQNFYILPHL